MRRSSREWIGGFVLLVVCVLAFVGLRALLLRRGDGGSAPADVAQLQAISDFERERLADSLRQQAHWDSIHAGWDAERAERQAARAAREAARLEREAAYADSLRVWAAEKMERAEARAERQAHYDSIRATYPEKLKRGSTIEANSADADALRSVPGIGESYAAKILAYRDALGGFVDARQLDEIEGLPYGISAWFRVQPPQDGVRQLNINTADFKALNRHPYLSYEQTKAIANLRRSARIRSWDDLRGCGLFTDADFQRLKPYFKF